MTPTEMKAEAFDHIVRVTNRTQPALKRLACVFGIIAKLERDEKRFWKRMAKFDADIMSGKNRMMKMTRVWHNFVFDAKNEPGTSFTETWNPDTKQWERDKPALPESQGSGN